MGWNLRTKGAGLCTVFARVARRDSGECSENTPPGAEKRRKIIDWWFFGGKILDRGGLRS
jgi:hypothetical protein